MAEDTVNSYDIGKEIAIPSFVQNRADGVYVDLASLYAAGGGLEIFVERLFNIGYFFAGLEYSLFLKLLYDEQWLGLAREQTPLIRLADHIVRFAPERRQLYRMVKLSPDKLGAEYVFEPVHLEEEYQEAQYGDPGPDGVAPVIGYETKTREVTTRLDFDELVADLWLKGVKFGLLEPEIRTVISSRQTKRMLCAAHTSPAPSRDAEIIEVCKELHRDNSPRLLANGKADLSVYKNRFPYVKKDTRLLRKEARRLGKPGRKVNGEMIEADIPKDVDLNLMSSVGTAVQQATDGEFLVATMNGYVTIDTRTNSFSIAERIEAKDGISARTTGDLALAADEFVEHGEVQEGRTVRGKHLTFLGDVYGNVISEGGGVIIAGIAAGGRIESRGGNIKLGKRATRTRAQAPDGEVSVEQAESSTLIGRIVRIGHAVNCEIVADELHAEQVEGCVIAARQIRIINCGERRGTETSITMLVPDYSEFRQRTETLHKELAGAQAAVAARRDEFKVAKAEPEFAKFLALRAQIESGALKLSAAQQDSWQKLVSKHVDTIQRLRALSVEIAAQDKRIQEVAESIVAVNREQEALAQGISCTIERVTGHTVGQTMRTTGGIAEFMAMDGSRIRNSLLIMDVRKARVFSEEGGAIDWKYRGAPGTSSVMPEEN